MEGFYAATATEIENTRQNISVEAAVSALMFYVLRRV